MSAGMRSGVNWMREPCSPITVDSVSTSRVLPRPGTPIRSPWPPHSSAESTRSTTASWPMKRRVIEARAAASRPSSASIAATGSASRVSVWAMAGLPPRTGWRLGLCEPRAAGYDGRAVG